MHKLDRTSIKAPDCLNNYDHNSHTWDDFEGVCKKQLRLALAQMQGISNETTVQAKEYGLRCAYCEGAIYHEGHIEHFRRKNAKHYPQLTFVWENLFLACGSNDHCGHYKDHKNSPPYNPDQLIKPDEHDPEDYLYFHSTGEVRVRHGLDDNKTNMANQTIRVFGLNEPTLVGSRSKALKSYKEIMLEEFDIVANWPPEYLQEYLADEVKKTRYHPYSTSIKHFLQIAF